MEKTSITTNSRCCKASLSGLKLFVKVPLYPLQHLERALFFLRKRVAVKILLSSPIVPSDGVTDFPRPLSKEGWLGTLSTLSGVVSLKSTDLPLKLKWQNEVGQPPYYGHTLLIRRAPNSDRTHRCKRAEELPLCGA